MKTRIADAFRKAKSEGRGAYVAYMTIGYPTLEKSEAAVETLIAEGADVIELGAPFSDPFADGAVIRSAAYEALRQHNFEHLLDHGALTGREEADGAWMDYL